MALPEKSNLNDNPTEGLYKLAQGHLYDTLVSEYFRIGASVDTDGTLLIALQTATGSTPSVDDPVSIRMRHPTLANGYQIAVDFSAATEVELVAGGSLAFSNGQKGKIYVWAVNNGTNKYLGLSRTPYHDETITHTTTTIGSGADTDSVIYTPTGISNAAIRLLAEMTITRGTDQWNAFPSNIFVTADRKPILLMPFIGCVPSNNGSDATNDLDFSAGARLDSTGLHLTIGGAMTKRADATWASGSGNGGKASGASAWGAADWHCFLLGKSNDRYAHDYVFDTSASCANGLADSAVIAAGFDIYKRVGSFRTASAAWPSFTARHKSVGLLEVLLKTPAFQFSKDWAGADDTAQTGTLAVPGGIQVIAIMGCLFLDSTAATTSSVIFTSFDQNDTAPDGVSTSFLGHFRCTNMGGIDCVSSGEVSVRTSTSRTIRYRATGSTVDHAVGVCLQGWEDSIL